MADAPAYFDDNLDEVFINFVPDELVKSILNGSDPNLNLIHTEVGTSDDSSKDIPKIVLKLSSDDAKAQSIDLWKKALLALLEDKSYFIGREEIIQKRRDTLKTLLSNLFAFQTTFENITLTLYTMIELSLPTTSLISEGRRLMWQRFYQYISSNSAKNDFYQLEEISTVENFDILVYKLSSKLLELLITANILSYTESSSSTSTTTAEHKMDDREQNIVKYVAGFIAHSAIKFYKRKSDEEGEKYVQVLKTWSVQGRQPKCFEFKNKWVDLRNRGGLVNVNDNCFLFFRAIEYSVRDVFNVVTLTNYAGENLKNVIKEKIYKRKYIMYRWDELIKGDELELSEKESLFKFVVVRWIDIRGKAFVRAWVDGLRSKYKDKVSDKGEHSHRKQLNVKRDTKAKSN